MKPKDILLLAVRLLGLGFVYRAFEDLPMCLNLITGPLVVGAQLAMAWCLLGSGGAWLARRAYPDTTPAATPTTH